MFKKGTILRTSLCWNLFRCENLPTVLTGVECMDNEALVRALRKFEQQNESLKKDPLETMLRTEFSSFRPQ